MDEGPSKDVYHQLEQLSKQNPVFVQSLQSIMTASHREDPGLAQQAPPTSPALLALLLASQIQPGSASLAGLAKKLESGTSVVELLQQALAQSPPAPCSSTQGKQTVAPPEPRPPLLPSPPAERSHIPGGTSDLAGLINRMTSTVTPQAPVVTPNTKSPQLQNMLYSAFQARISQQGETEAPLPPTSPPKEDPPAQTQPPQSVASYPVNLQATYSVVAAPSYYQSPPPSHLQQPSNLTQMLSQPPPPPPPSHNQQHLASDHSWAAQAPLLVHAPLMAHPQALWAAQPALYHAQHAPQHQAASSQKRKVDVEYPNYSDLEAPGLKRQKLCGN